MDLYPFEERTNLDVHPPPYLATEKISTSTDLKKLRYTKAQTSL
jgi:hypothetical protein